MTRTCPWGTKPQGDHHPGEPCTLAIDHLGPCVSASERPRVHRARGITGIAIRCPQCGAPVGQPCDLAVPDAPPATVHPARRVGGLAMRCRWCGAEAGDPCTFPAAPPPPHDPEETMRVRSVCSCGASLDVSGSPADAMAVRDLFATLHPEPGHTRTPPPRED